jgi:hypothetical protein
MDALAAGHNAAVQMIDISRRAGASTRGLYSGQQSSEYGSFARLEPVLPADTGLDIPRPRTVSFSARIFLSPKNDHTPVAIQPRHVGTFISRKSAIVRQHL